MARTSGYRNPVKQSWRDNVWEDIAKHCRNTDGYILTLAGKAFLDRKEAKRHGIDLSRLIGVDIDADVVAHNRRHKRTVIHAPLHEVIALFNRPIAVINADLCCGAFSLFTANVVRNFMHSKWTKQAMLVLNVSVGREVQKCVLDSDGNNVRPSKLGPDLHRGLLALKWHAVAGVVDVFCEANGLRKTDISEETWHAAHDFLQPRIDKSIVACGQYVAHRQRMDSVICRQFFNGQVSFSNNLRISRHIAAKMAHHTMRFGA